MIIIGMPDEKKWKRGGKQNRNQRNKIQLGSGPGMVRSTRRMLCNGKVHEHTNLLRLTTRMVRSSIRLHYSKLHLPEKNKTDKLIKEHANENGLPNNIMAVTNTANGPVHTVPHRKNGPRHS